MQLPLSFFIGLRYTLARKRSRSVSFISAIAMLGIILGVALLITVLSVMNGFDRELKQRILSIMPQVTLYQQGGLKDWRQMREQILSADNIIAASPFVELQLMLYTGKNTQPALVYGVDAELEGSVSTIQGYLQVDSLNVLNQQPDTIVLGRGLADKLQASIGDRITLIMPRLSTSNSSPSVRRVELIDIFQSGTELDNGFALMGLSQAAALLNDDSSGIKSDDVISGLHLKVSDLFLAPRIAANLRNQLPFDFYTNDWTRTHGNIYYAIKMSKNLVSLLLLLIIAIAAFNVVSTLVMVVVDKQGDIAILRTLGLTRRQIMSVFMVQGTVIGILGTGIGVCLGVIFSLTVDDFVAALEGWLEVRFLQSDIYPVSFLPSSLQLNDVILITAVSLSMSLLATIYPARKAAGVQPAQALRYE